MLALAIPYLLVFVAALVATLLLTPLVRETARRLGMVDSPDARRINTVPIPRGGGLAIVLGVYATYLFLLAFTDRPLIHGLPDAKAGALFALSGAIALLGLADDKFSLSPKAKLLGQVEIGRASCRERV